MVLAMVPLAAMDWAGPDAVIGAFRRFSPLSPSLVHTGSDDTTMTFQAGEHTVFLSLMPAPIPWSDLEHACSGNIFWPQAAEALRSHVAHYIVTVQGESTPIRARVVLTRFIGALLSVQACSGVYWGESSLVVKPELFMEMAEGLEEQQVPSMLWIHFALMAGTKPHTASFFTIGMANFGLMEIEVVDSRMPLAELHERACDLAAYLISAHQTQPGPIIQNGHTFGWTAQEKFLVRHQASQFGVPGQVYRIYC